VCVGMKIKERGHGLGPEGVVITTLYGPYAPHKKSQSHLFYKHQLNARFEWMLYSRVGDGRVVFCQIRAVS
jgi:hypothetical protein